MAELAMLADRADGLAYPKRSYTHQLHIIWRRPGSSPVKKQRSTNCAMPQTNANITVVSVQKYSLSLI